MKTKHFKQLLAEKVICDDEMNMLWECYDKLRNEPDAKQVFLDVNKDEFKNELPLFYPQITPFSDYILDIDGMCVKKDKLIFKTGKPKALKYKSDPGVYKVYIDGKCIKYTEREYFRLEFITIIEDALKKGKDKFSVFKFASSEKRFYKNRKYKFTVDLSEKACNAMLSSKFIAIYAYFRNSRIDVNTENGEAETQCGITCSFSDTNYIFSCEPAVFADLTQKYPAEYKNGITRISKKCAPSKSK